MRGTGLSKIRTAACNIIRQSLNPVAFGLTVALATSVFAAERPAFPADVTSGDVRLVLMSVGQTTVFANEKDYVQGSPSWREKKDGVPCFTVTFLLELLGDKPYEPKTLRNFEVLSGGKAVRLVNDQKGSYQQWFDYQAFQDFLDFSKPKVSDPQRAFIMRHVEFAALPNLQPVSLVIEAGFGKDVKKFSFDSIRLQ